MIICVSCLVDTLASANRGKHLQANNQTLRSSAGYSIPSKKCKSMPGMKKTEQVLRRPARVPLLELSLPWRDVGKHTTRLRLNPPSPRMSTSELYQAPIGLSGGVC